MFSYILFDFGLLYLYGMIRYIMWGKRGIPVRLKKRLNNNAVIASDDQEREYVIFGNGIAFDIKKEETIPKDRIERVFFQKEKTLLQQLIEEIPQKYFDLSCDIIDYIEGNLKSKLSNSIYITLMDHISFIKERAEKELKKGRERKIIT